MPDLTPSQSSLPTRIVGAVAATGVPTGYVTSDAQGGVIVAGEGTAGTPVGGVLTIQGIANAIKIAVALSDSSSNGITSTAINSKQRLDVNLASEAVDGATAPFLTQQIGGKDPSGNAQAISVDVNGVLQVAANVPLTPGTPAAITVGTSSASILAANSVRKGLIITNQSANKIFLGLGTAAVINAGICLLPGGQWNMNEYCFTTLVINAIASAASSAGTLQEFSV